MNSAREITQAPPASRVRPLAMGMLLTAATVLYVALAIDWDKFPGALTVDPQAWRALLINPTFADHRRFPTIADFFLRNH